MIIDRNKLDIVRASKKMRLKDLCVSKNTLQRINTEQELMPQTVGKVAEALGCDVTDILKGGEDQ